MKERISQACQKVEICYWVRFSITFFGYNIACSGKRFWAFIKFL